MGHGNNTTIYGIQCWEYDGCNGWWDYIADGCYTANYEQACEYQCMLRGRDIRCEVVEL